MRRHGVRRRVVGDLRRGAEVSKQTKAELLAELEAMRARAERAEANEGIRISDCQFGSFNELHSDAVIALAQAALANAKAIKAIANKTVVQIETGIRIEGMGA